MNKKHLTQIFPWLLPMRKKQRQLCFYTAMRFDRNRYAETRLNTILPCLHFTSSCPMYNTQTGLDMVYQENKVFNLKLAAKKIDRLVICPGETFSFCWATRHADRETPYKEGLTEIYGNLTTEQGGGLCMLSNLLFWLFLHTPITIIERHGHRKKDFPEPPSDAPFGVDATVAAGWLDLKVRNDTGSSFQITIGFDDTSICGSIYSDTNGAVFRVFNGPVGYYRDSGIIYEEVDVCREIASGEIETLYRNRCQIGYLKLDTGMRRLGERSERIEEIANLFQCRNLIIEGAYTHLCADDGTSARDRAFTEVQAKAFSDTIRKLEQRGYSCGKKHLLASYGLLNYPELGGNYARVGIALYGVLSNRADLKTCPITLKPILSLKARIATVKEVFARETVGYSFDYRAEREMKIAVLTIGYADGLPRALSNGRGSVLVNGRRAPIVGRICMDQAIVDATDIPEVNQGDIAVVVGRSGENEITAYDIAEQSGTITNEVLSRLGGRLVRIIL